MLSRDLIASVVRTFFEELNDVRDGGKEKERRYVRFYMDYFQKESQFFVRGDMPEITAFFVDDPIQKIEMLAELMYRDAGCMPDLDLQCVMYRRIIELYDLIDRRSMDFSIERMNRVAELRNKLGK